MTQGGRTPDGPGSRWIELALAGIITFAVYVPSLGNDFVDWDDGGNIVHNERYRGLGADQLSWMFTTFAAGHFQPLSWVTLGLDYAIWGMNPRGYHLTNAILHALTAIAFAAFAAWVFEELRQRTVKAGAPIGLSRTAAWFGVLVSLGWSLHPLRVEGVTWVTERREVLCGLFTVLAVLSHLRGQPRWVTAALMVLGLLSKATAVTIPVAVVLVDLWRAGFTSVLQLVKDAARAVARHAVLVALAVAASVVAVMAQRDARAMVSYETLSLARRIVLTCYACWFSVAKTLWPSDLAALHQGNVGTTWEFHAFVWWGAAAGFAMVLAAIAIGWWRRRRGLGWLALTAAFLAMIAPAGGLGQSGPQTAAERYTYQPGWVLALAAGFAVAGRTRWPERWWANWRAATPTILVLAALAFLSMRQQGFWRDTEALWLRQVAVYPLSPTGNHHLGFWYLERAEPAKAEPYLRASVVAAPTYPGPRLTLAGLLVSTSRPDEALATIEPVLNVTQDPKELAPALFLAARIHWDAGRHDEAIELQRRLLAADPKSAESYRQLAKAQAAAGHPREAIETFERGVAVAPDSSILADFAWLLATHPDAAVRDGRRAVELAERAIAAKPADFRAVLVRAAARAEAGDFEQAAREVEAAIPGLPPQNGPALKHLVEDLSKRQPVRAEPRFP